MLLFFYFLFLVVVFRQCLHITDLQQPWYFFFRNLVSTECKSWRLRGNAPGNQIWTPRSISTPTRSLSAITLLLCLALSQWEWWRCAIIRANQHVFSSSFSLTSLRRLGRADDFSQVISSSQRALITPRPLMDSMDIPVKWQGILTGVSSHTLRPLANSRNISW